MTTDEEGPRRLRDIAEQLAASIPDSPQRGRDVSNEPRIPRGRPGGGQWTRDDSSQETRRSNRLAKTHTPAPFLDDHGNPVLDGKHEPMRRPADVNMTFFVDKGLEAGLRGVAWLPNFGHGQDWDIQRVDPGSNLRTDPAFVDAANVAIGLYGAAAGIPQAVVLEAANIYAGSESNYRGAPMDSTYGHLSKQDADDIRLGYTLYKSGRIGHTRPK